MESAVDAMTNKATIGNILENCRKHVGNNIRYKTMCFLLFTVSAFYFLGLLARR